MGNMTWTRSFNQTMTDIAITPSAVSSDRVQRRWDWVFGHIGTLLAHYQAVDDISNLRIPPAALPCRRDQQRKNPLLLSSGRQCKKYPRCRIRPKTDPESNLPLPPEYHGPVNQINRGREGSLTSYGTTSGNGCDYIDHNGHHRLRRLQKRRLESP